MGKLYPYRNRCEVCRKPLRSDESKLCRKCRATTNRAVAHDIMNRPPSLADQLAANLLALNAAYRAGMGPGVA